MKILLTSTSLHASYGGPAYSVARLADELSSLGHDIALWSADGSRPSAHVKYRLVAGTLNEAVSEFGSPDVVHDNGIWLQHNHWIAALTSKKEIPRVVSTRGMLEPWARNHKRLKKKIAWSIYQRRDLTRASRIHATSAIEAANIVRLGLQVPVVIPNGVDVPVSNRNEELADVGPHRKAVFIGRIHPVKGLPMLVDAWSRVRPAKWELIIAGPDEAGHRNEVENVVRIHGMTTSISFVGQVEGVEKDLLLRSADLFVLPTYSESFGMAVAEALAYAIPVLTTTAAPWPIIEDLNCGWLAEPNREAVQTALRVATQLSDSELRAMGERGRTYIAQNLSWPMVAREFVKLYTGLA